MEQLPWDSATKRRFSHSGLWLKFVLAPNQREIHRLLERLMQLYISLVIHILKIRISLHRSVHLLPSSGPSVTVWPDLMLGFIHVCMSAFFYIDLTHQQTCAPLPCQFLSLPLDMLSLSQVRFKDWKDFSDTTSSGESAWCWHSGAITSRVVHSSNSLALRANRPGSAPTIHQCLEDEAGGVQAAVVRLT